MDSTADCLEKLETVEVTNRSESSANVGSDTNSTALNNVNSSDFGSDCNAAALNGVNSSDIGSDTNSTALNNVNSSDFGSDCNTTALNSVNSSGFGSDHNSTAWNNITSSDFNSGSNNTALNDINFPASVQQKQMNAEKLIEEENLHLNKHNIDKDSQEGSLKNSSLQNEGPIMENSSNEKIPLSGDLKITIQNEKNNGNLSEVIVRSLKPLCADYQSDSDSESDEGKSDDSFDTATSTSSDSEFESDDSLDSSIVESKIAKGDNKLKGDISLIDLPPIENLKISVPEDACVEIGLITSIVETLVIVESYKGTSALDVDTILFLDYGRQTLGKVFDILGPVSEPVYAVRFNSQEQINSLNIKKDMKVYYAPRTEHTTFVFLSEVLKNRGSDASWKDNAEAPPEFQDFSDDEEERQHKNKHTREPDNENPYQSEQNTRKRQFNKSRQPSGVFQGNRFRNPDLSHPRPCFHRQPAVPQFVPPSPFPRTNFPSSVQIPPFPYNVPPYSTSRPPHIAFSPRFSGPPFPTFGGLAFVNQSQNFQQPFYQQRTHPFFQPFGAWGRPMFGPPPPPPPPTEQGHGQSTSEVRP